MGGKGEISGSGSFEAKLTPKFEKLPKLSLKPAPEFVRKQHYMETVVLPRLRQRERTSRIGDETRMVASQVALATLDVGKLPQQPLPLSAADKPGTGRTAEAARTARTESHARTVPAAQTESVAPPMLPADDPSGCVNEEEKKLYADIIEQALEEEGSTAEDKEALRVKIMESIFQPQVFRAHYIKWKWDYERDQNLRAKFPSLEDYTLEMGKTLIKFQLHEVVDGRVKQFAEENMLAASVGGMLGPMGGLAAGVAMETAGKESMELMKKVERFMEEHEDALQAYPGLDEKDPQRAALYKKFVIECGFQGFDQTEVRDLFEDIVDDVQVAFIAGMKFEAQDDGMVQMTQDAIDNGEEIDEDAWNKMLEDEMKKDPYFKEVMQQQQAPVYQFTEGRDTSKAPLDTPQDVANLAGVQIVGGVVYDAKTNTYTCQVRFPDSALTTTMVIEGREGSKTFDDANFVIRDPYADKSKGNAVEMDKQSLRAGCNQMFLDYLMNDYIQKNKMSTDVSVNDILPDKQMARMAENLFGKSMDQMVITFDRRQMFQNFLMVVMKGDSADTPYGNLGSFESRVKIMDTVLMSPDYASALRSVLANPGSVTFTVSTLLDRINYKERIRT